jgi:adenylate cyclase
VAEERIKRRLAAILAADVVGYSRLMEADEEGTLVRMKKLRTDVIDPKIAEYNGRIFKTTGDGILAEFPSAVDAVRHAVDVQRAMAGINAELAKEKRIAFRIGISLGDVMVDGDDLFGNGVNVAARMEGLAEPGAICISGNVQEHISNSLDVALEDLGEQSVKNIDRPVRCYRIHLVSAGIKIAPPLISNRPAVAVLPFVNMSGDPEQEYFADGLTEDIITALSLWRSFPVIARNSTFAYKGLPLDVRKVGDELGARYVVEGSIRKSGERVRITAQLIDASSGHHIWAERYDANLNDIFELQDEITTKVASVIEPELTQLEFDKTANRQTKDLAAWEFYTKGSVLLYYRTKDGHIQAREFLEQAVRLDPTFSRAYANLAFTYHRDLYQGSAGNREELLSKMTDVSTKAVSAGPRDATARSSLALNLIWRGEQEKAVAEGRTAILLNPSEAAAHVSLGLALDVAGEPEEALFHLENAARLNPRDPRNEIFETIVARACLHAHRYEGAIDWASKALQTRENYDEARLILASALGHLSRQDEVASAIQIERLGPPDLDFVQRAWTRYKDDNAFEHMADGLRKAGLRG